MLACGMENPPPCSAADGLELPATAPLALRISEMCHAVAGGLTVRVAIRQHFRSKNEYYTAVTLEDRLFIRRLSSENRNRAEPGDGGGEVLKVSVYVARDRHSLLVSRTQEVSLQKRRLVTLSEYINTLIAADLRTIDSNSSV